MISILPGLLIQTEAAVIVRSAENKARLRKAGNRQGAEYVAKFFDDRYKTQPSIVTRGGYRALSGLFSFGQDKLHASMITDA